ncbi:MAG TPA: iron-sulfur cluster carrier protein ApbC [Bacteroidota bacterium]|nr:iron-sulfur cluster carrier protein ApbC [Bacteroidota bacterium]
MKKALTELNILEALKLVQDPDLHKDIVSLGFIKDLKIENGSVRFTIDLTTPSCPVRDEFKVVAEKAIRDNIDGVKDVHIDLTATVRTTPQRQVTLLPGVKNTIAVASGKGGVGKSTVAVNLAVSLALDGAKVGLLDADIYGPSIPLMMGTDKRPQLVNQKLLPLEAHGVKVMSIGFLVDPMQAVIWRGPMVSGAVKQFMSDVEWGDLDYLVFDLPPGTGDIHLTLVQTIPLSGAVVVTTPQDISLADARKAFKMFEKVNVPILGIIENMSYHICSNCGHREDIFSSGGGEKEAAELKSPFLGAIPIYTPIRVGGDIGKPIVVMEPKAEQSEIIRSIARKMAAQLSIRQFEAKPQMEISLNV